MKTKNQNQGWQAGVQPQPDGSLMPWGSVGCACGPLLHPCLTMTTTVTVERAIELQEQSWAEGKLDEASCACREALRLMELAEGTDSPDVANLLNDLAEIEQEQENFAEALALAERARSIEDTLGEPFTGKTSARIRVKTLAIAGGTRRIQGNYTQAEDDLKNALAISLAEWGDASEEAAEARNNLTVLYKYCGRFDDGLKLYTQAAAAIFAIHGEESQASATVYHNIGGIFHARRDFAAAEAPARRAWEISRRLRGKDDPQTMLDAAAYAGSWTDSSATTRANRSTAGRSRSLNRHTDPSTTRWRLRCTIWPPRWPPAARWKKVRTTTAARWRSKRSCSALTILMWP